MIMISISYIDFWDEPPHQIWFTKFLEYHFGSVKIVPYNSNPDILLCSCLYNTSANQSLALITRTKSKCKLFFYGENLDRYQPYNDYSLLRSTFDLIVGFKQTDPSRKQIRFPLWLLYYPYYCWNDTENIVTHIETQYESLKGKQNMFGTIVSSHDTFGQRTKIYNELDKHGTIRSPGRFKNNTLEIGPTSKDKIEYISNSLYNICCENSAFEGYCTEKIFQALEAGTIPLYWANDLPEPNIIERHKYVFCDVNNAESLESSINHACKNPNQYLSGPVFTKDARKHIKSFYDILITSIKNKLFP